MNQVEYLEQEEKVSISIKFIETLLHVQATTCNTTLEDITTHIKELLPDFFKANVTSFMTQSILDSFQVGTLYHITDAFSLNFLCFLYHQGEQIVIVGPYITKKPEENYFKALLEENGSDNELLSSLYQYCFTLPVIPNSSILNGVIRAMKIVLGEQTDINYNHYQPLEKHHKELSNLVPEHVESATTTLLEKRYYYENKMIQEVIGGNHETALSCFESLKQCCHSLIQSGDTLYKTKALSISLNTMLRKSAETVGIHPIYLNMISSNFSALIENSNNQEDLLEFFSQMVSVYCRFVQKWRLDKYSPIVRKSITYIQLHLSDHLTLTKIAREINVSSSYLSKLFNEETNCSISNYISKVRIEKATELLTFSNMSIQNIAVYVGFSDLNYFSRCFKKEKGLTPTEYRQRKSINI